MDHKLTEQLGKWLSQSDATRSITEGAELFLRLSNNRVMYNSFLRNPNEKAHRMLAYQLQKYYNFRVQHLTHDEVTEMATAVAEIAVKDHLLPIPERAASEAIGRSESGNTTRPDGDGVASKCDVDVERARKGLRPDHDSLPAEIQALYVENQTILQRMRNLHAKLELLSTENASCPDSERYPFLKEIIALDKQYHENWNRYDHFVLSAVPAPEEQTNEQPTEAAAPSAHVSADTSAETRPASAPAEPSQSDEQPAPVVEKPKAKRTTRKTTKK